MVMHLDMSMERNALMEEVYPRIKDYCRERHGLEFQVVDMRWGVRDEATDDHMTTDLCMREIENCQRLSMGPNFVTFLGQKYGYRPIPTIIDGKEFRLIRETLTFMNIDVYLLDLWYREDTNSVPSVFVLQPISSILINFNNKKAPKQQAQDQATWWNTLEKLQILLRKAANTLYLSKKMDHEAMHNYMMSVTEREVINGLLKVRNTRNHCLAYVRQINYVDMNNLKEVGKFIDLSGRTVDIEAQRLLADLRDSRVPERIEKSNIVKYTVNWTGKEGLSPSYHKEYLDEFTAHFYKRIIRLVDRAMRKEDLSSEGHIITEILQHLHAAKASVQTFQGRQAELETIKRYIQSESNQPLVLHGEGGCGKTSLLAKAASMVSEWSPSNTKPILILRFLGTTPDSSSVAPMLTSVCQQIMYNYSMPWEGIPDDLIPLVAFTKRLLTKVTSDQAAYIFLDSVDQLAGKCDTNKLSWIPTRLPLSVKFVVSVVSEGSCPEFSAIKRIVQNEDQFVEVPSLGPELAEQTLASWLRDAKRDLSKYQWKVVRRAIDKCTLPIFIKLIYAEVIRWRSYTRSTETTLAHSVGDSIMKLFERIEMQHGRILVSHALSYITAAKSGLSETELEDLISLDDIVLDDVYQYHMPPVRRIPPLLWTRIRRDLPNYLSEREADGLSVMNWYHHQFRTASIARYFGKSEMVKYFHSSIAEYFLGTWGGGKCKPFKYTEVQRHRFGLADKEGAADRKVPLQPHVFYSKDGSVLRYNKRKFGELPFQLIRACRFSDLYSHVLLSYSWLHAKISCCPLQAVLSDYEDAIEHISDVDICKQLNIIADALRLGSLVLGEYPDMLASQIIGTLLPVKGMFPRVADLISQCDEEGPNHCALVPAFHCLHTPGGPLKYSLEGHPFAVFGLVLTSDQRFVISASNKFLMFDLCTGDLAREVDPEIMGIMQTLALSRDDKYAVSYTNYEEIIVFNVITGDIEKIKSPLQENKILDVSIIKDTVCAWSKREWITFPAENSPDVTHHTLEIDDAVVAHIYLVDNEHFCLTSCLSDCYLLTTIWNERKFKDLKFRGGLTFHSVSTETAVFLTQEADEGFHVLKLVTGKDEWVEDCVLGKITNPVHALHYSEDDSYLAAIHKTGFTVWCTQSRKRADLHLPYNVRNISIGPFRSQSSIVLTRNKQYAVAGVRKSLYIWNFAGGRLLKEVDAHFSRILSVKSLNTDDYNALVTSSIDRSIKVWNVQNIFEKVHAIDRMELAIDAVSVTADDVLAVTLTRSNVGVWSVATGKLWSRLVDNPIGAIITHSTVTANGSYVISYESGFILVWNLQQGVVTERAEQPNVQQLLLTDDDSHLLVTWKQNDKLSYCTMRGMPNLEVIYSLSFESDVAKPAALTKDSRFLVIISKVSNRECLLVHDARNGKLLSNIAVDSRHFIGFRGICAFPGKAEAVSITGNEASIIIDVEKETFRSFSYWGGSCTRDGRYGLVAPPGGGLDIIDLKTGKTEKVLLPPVSEGVFSVVPKFTQTDEHVLFYHSGKKTMRLFRVSDGRMIANYRLSAEVSDFTSTNDGTSVIICGVDGSFVVLAVVDSSMPETKENLKQLPSRSDTNILSLRPTITFKTVAKVTARAAYTKRQLSREDSVSTNSCVVS